MIQKQQRSAQKPPRKLFGIAAIAAAALAIIMLLICAAYFSSGLSGQNPSAEIVSELTTEKVAYVIVEGEIATTTDSALFSGASGASSTEIVSRLEDIRDDPSIKGVIFEINSPGGSGVASDEIATAIRDLNKPTVSYIRENGASGAYWVASSTDYIYANRFSTVGSIGVISGWLDFADLLSDFNVRYQRFVAGDLKDFGTPYRHITPSEEAKYQAQLDELHSMFISDVAKGRNLDEEYVRGLADGFIFTGQGAVDNGLADAIGGKKEAIAHMEEALGAKVEIVEYGYEFTIWDYFTVYSSSISRNIGRGIADVMFAKNNSLSIRT